jgi:nucleoside-diphosphate-sugar epimerase
LRFLVTGSSGFVGKNLALYLADHGHEVLACVRVPELLDHPRIQPTVINDLCSIKSFDDLVGEVDVIIHCAAVSSSQNLDTNGISNLYEINVDVTKRIALAASKHGGKRFIFLSTVKVLGEHTLDGELFSEQSPWNPQDAYAESKVQAESTLQSIARSTALDTLILRLPPVYGVGMKGNIQRLLKLVNKGVPLPLGALHNQRSMVGIDNLCHLVLTSASQPPVSVARTFMVSDGHDLSVVELLKILIDASGNRSILLPVSRSALAFLGRILGRRAEMSRLMSNLRVDSRKIALDLNWAPPIAPDIGLRRLVEGQ